MTSQMESSTRKCEVKCHSFVQKAILNICDKQVCNKQNELKQNIGGCLILLKTSIWITRLSGSRPASYDKAPMNFSTPVLESGLLAKHLTVSIKQTA